MLIAQLSDLHVCAPEVLYHGLIDSNEMLVRAIDSVLELDLRPDFVVITGDVTADGLPEEYEHACALLGRLPMPWYVIPGNHDKREAFRQAFRGLGFLPETGPLNYAVSLGNLNLVALDSTDDCSHAGSLDDQTLLWLEDALLSFEGRPALVVMHHPPFSCGISYLDAYGCVDGEKLAGLIGRHRGIEAVLCGHVHRSIVRKWANTLAMSAPSTASEIALRLSPLATPASFSAPVGYLLHMWSPVNGLVTHLVRSGLALDPLPFF
ncbi:phosphodiesterase [Rhizobacter sp. Root404]|uniref:phosphodiesterase n=1 Tax=Rhizobacter sp. Root404 TaxID=1736528 RepID=UPI00138F4260|nr:phosphodiesterase [Rhizobacter sp. Root404]